MQSSRITSPIKKPIYCNEEITAACDLINSSYDRKLSYIAEMIKGDPLFDEERARCYDYSCLLSEHMLIDMFDWVSKNGWDIDYPVNGKKIELKNRNLVPITYRPGKRVQLTRLNGNAITEYDCLVKINGNWVIGEAKCRENSFRRGEAKNKIKKLGKQLDEDVGFILGVPKNHEMNTSEKRKEVFESKGGIVVSFPYSWEEIESFAETL